MTQDARRQRQRTALREKILNAARELFVSEGYDAVTMRKIAQRVEYSATAIYSYFPDKEALLYELCDTDFKALTDRLRPLARIADPLERLKKAGLAYIDFSIKHPNQYRLMFMQHHPVLDADKSRLRQGNTEEDAYAWLRQTVTECIARDYFTPEFQDPDLAVQSLWCAMHGIVSLHIVNVHGSWVAWRPLKKRVEAMLGALMVGFLRPPR